MPISAQDASAALDDIDAMARRVRQSRIYHVASLIIPLWGVLTFVGYIVTFATPRHAILAWAVIDIAGILASLAISMSRRGVASTRMLEYRLLAAFALMVAFGLLWTKGFTQLPPRALSAFWPTYFMLGYTLAGLWLGTAFVAIGLGVTALTIVAFALSGDSFDLWMAFIDGGGLMLGGLWMRRG